MVIEIRPTEERIQTERFQTMNPTTTALDLTYRFSTEHQAALRQEATQAHVSQVGDRRSGEPLTPTRGPLAALRRRLVGATSFA